MKNKTLILLVISLLVLIGGTSYAAYNWVYTGGTANSISTSDISLKFLESNTEIINITNALPMEDYEGIYEPSFDFAVTSTTTRDVKIKYTLNIEKLSLDTGYTALNDNQIKVYLTDYDNNQIVAPTLIGDLDNYKLYTGLHTHNSANETIQHKFKLRVWIDSDLIPEAENWTASTKLQYKFKIGISSNEYNPTYTYRYGTNTISIGDPSSNITGGTSNPSTLNKQFYLKHAIDNNTVAESFVCYTLNSTEYCLKGADTSAYSDNVSILQNSFGASNCNETNATGYSYYLCSSASLGAYADSDGHVYADYDGSSCHVNGDGNSICYGGK